MGWTLAAHEAMMGPMRKLRIALIVGLILAIPATAYAYYEMAAEDCPCSH